MNRREPESSRQQYAGYDSPRQAAQWQEEPGRQTGGGRDQVSMRGATAPGIARHDESYGGDQDFGGTDDGYTGRGVMRHDDAPGYPPREREDGVSRGWRGGYGRGYQGGYFQGSQPGRYPDENYGAARSGYAPFTSQDYGGRDRFAGNGWTGNGRSGPWYGGARSGADEYGHWREYGEQRGFFERAGDEIASWFGDEDAARRRKMDHRGRGPKGYTRSDERICDDVNDCLTHDRGLDASEVRVRVEKGEVTLDGHVDDRSGKRRAEDLAESVSGVRHVQNNLRVQEGQKEKASTGNKVKTG